MTALLVVGDKFAELEVGLEVAKKLGCTAWCVRVNGYNDDDEINDLSSDPEKVPTDRAQTLPNAVGWWGVSPVQAVHLMATLGTPAMIADLAWIGGDGVMNKIKGYAKIKKEIEQQSDAVKAAFGQLESDPAAGRFLGGAWGAYRYLIEGTGTGTVVLVSSYAVPVKECLVRAGCDGERITALESLSTANETTKSMVQTVLQGCYQSVSLDVNGLWDGCRSLWNLAVDDSEWGNQVHTRIDALRGATSGSVTRDPFEDLLRKFVGLSQKHWEDHFRAKRSLHVNVSEGFKCILGCSSTGITPHAAWLVALSAFNKVCPSADWTAALDPEAFCALPCSAWKRNLSVSHSSTAAKRDAINALHRMFCRLSPWEDKKDPGAHSSNLVGVFIETKPARLVAEYRMRASDFWDKVNRTRPGATASGAHQASQAVWHWLGRSVLRQPHDQDPADQSLLDTGVSVARMTIAPGANGNGTVFTWSPQ